MRVVLGPFSHVASPDWLPALGAVGRSSLRVSLGLESTSTLVTEQLLLNAECTHASYPRPLLAPPRPFPNRGSRRRRPRLSTCDATESRRAVPRTVCEAGAPEAAPTPPSQPTGLPGPRAPSGVSAFLPKNVRRVISVFPKIDHFLVLLFSVSWQHPKSHLLEEQRHWLLRHESKLSLLYLL